MNLVIITGRLGQDPELRYTQNQTAVTTLSVATTEREKIGGQWQETTEWHRVVVWAKQAENAQKYLKKGSKVAVTGRIKTRSWEDQSSVKKYATEIVADKVEYLDSKKDNQGQGEPDAYPAASQGAPSVEELGF